MGERETELQSVLYEFCNRSKENLFSSLLGASKVTQVTHFEQIFASIINGVENYRNLVVCWLNA